MHTITTTNTSTNNQTSSNKTATRTKHHKSTHKPMQALMRKAAAITVLLTMMVSLLMAASASAQESSPAEGVQYAAAVTGPSTVYLESSWEIWVKDEEGLYFNNGSPFEFTSRCSGFAVEETGYIATAGHCVDPDDAASSIVESLVIDQAQAGTYVDGNGNPVSAAALYEFATLNWQTEGRDSGEKPEPSVAVALGAGGGSQDVLPARVLDYTGLEDGDWALLKVNAQDLPVAELAADTNIFIGTEVLSVGFPASSDQVVDATGPTFKDGRISSEKTRGNGLLPVYEISAAISGGMSGGPTVDMAGRVVGVNSFSIVGEDQQFNFISPVSLLKEMMARNGVSSALSQTDADYRSAVAAFLTGQCGEAEQILQAVTIQWPNHRTAADYLNDARKCIADGGSTTVIDTGDTPEGAVADEPTIGSDAPALGDTSVNAPADNSTTQAPVVEAGTVETASAPAQRVTEGGDNGDDDGLPLGLIAGVGIGLAGLGAGVMMRRKDAAPAAQVPAAPAAQVAAPEANHAAAPAPVAAPEVHDPSATTVWAAPNEAAPTEVNHLG